jgi:hypothetical protein
VLGQVSYRSQTVILAGTLLSATDRVDPGPTARGSLLSLMGVYRIPASRLAVIGRYDAHDPDTGSDDDALDRIIAGVSYQLNPNLRLLLDVDHTWYQGQVAPATDATRSQALFQVQVVF